MRVQMLIVCVFLTLIQLTWTQIRAPLVLPSRTKLTEMRKRLSQSGNIHIPVAMPKPTFLRRGPAQPLPVPKAIRPPAGKRILTGSVVVPGSNKALSPSKAATLFRTNLNLTPIRVDLTNIIREAVHRVKAEDATMKRRFDNGIDKDSSSFHAIEPILFSESPLNAEDISRQGRIINWIARLVKNTGTGLSVREALTHSEAIRQGVQCPYKRPVCDFRNKYRTLDGTCNNIVNPLLGSAFTPFKREIASQYAQDFHQKRDDLPKINDIRNAPLKSPRDISLIVHQRSGLQNDDSIWTMEFSLWGQFLSHDLTDKAPVKGFNGSMIHCCDQSIPTSDDSCMNIMTKPGDVFRRFNRPCLDFARSLEVTSLDCNQGVREQLNQASSFIDGSAIYGITEDRSRALRAFWGGRLAVSEPNELPIMPHGNGQATMHGFSYFGSGDDRVNVYAGLIAIETVWLREHNRIADQLSNINPHWNDEKIFQETRRIVIALVQHITYTDYLKGTVGDVNMALFQLRPQRNGYFNGYNNSADPSLSNAFASSALRFGHSMIRDSFTKRDRSYTDDGSPALKMKDIFFRSSVFLKEEDQLMRGFVFDPSPKCDRFVSDGLANHLHQTREGNGGDLAAMNIQRNRDHALPSYNSYRQLYGLTSAKQFDNSPQGFTDQTAETINRFRQVYSHPDDVELWTGGLSEIPVDSKSAVGPLFAKMIARQFKDLKTGDRFFYETSDPSVRFTLAQLDSIRQVRFSRILCNTMKFDTIQPNVFLIDTHSNNRRVPCTSLADLNLFNWRE